MNLIQTGRLPTAPGERIVLLDGLRGIALLGILLMNFPLLAPVFLSADHLLPLNATRLHRESILQPFKGETSAENSHPLDNRKGYVRRKARITGLMPGR